MNIGLSEVAPMSPNIEVLSEPRTRSAGETEKQAFSPRHSVPQRDPLLAGSCPQASSIRAINSPNQAFCRPFELPSLIRNSSILRPDFIAATSHRGRLPRPAQVSDVWGLRYFGNTLGYLRRGLPSCGDRDSPDRAITSVPRFRTANRLSSSCFSALIRADKSPLICSWSDQRSSNDMDSNSVFLADMLQPCLAILSFLILQCHIVTSNVNQVE